MGMVLTTEDVAQDTVGDLLVSTLYFGYGAMYGQPVYWETAVVYADPATDGEPYLDLWDRYTDREAAVEGHARVLAEVRTREAGVA